MESADIAIGIIVSLIIAAVIFTVSGKTSNTAISDHTAETTLVALGIRNNMIYTLSSEFGRMLYNAPGGEPYDAIISKKTLSVTYDGVVIKQSYKPTVEIPHYMPKTIEKSIVSNSFCIVKKQDADCNSYVEVCAADDMSCCKTVICGG